MAKWIKNESMVMYRSINMSLGWSECKTEIQYSGYSGLETAIGAYASLYIAFLFTHSILPRRHLKFPGAIFKTPVPEAALDTFISTYLRRRGFCYMKHGERQKQDYVKLCRNLQNRKLNEITR